MNESLIDASVGLASYQESFAVDPNEVLRQDRFSVEFASHRLQDARHATSQPHISIKEEPQFSEDDELASRTPNLHHLLFNNNNNCSNNNNNNCSNNNNNTPQIIHSANSRLLNCSQMFQGSNSPNSPSTTSSPAMTSHVATSSPRTFGGLHHQPCFASAPTSPINISGRRGKSDLHLNVKLVSTYTNYFGKLTEDSGLVGTAFACGITRWQFKQKFYVQNLLQFELLRLRYSRSTSVD